MPPTNGRPSLSGGSGDSPIITLRLPAALFHKMEEAAKAEGVHRNQIVRAALDAYVHGRTTAPQPLADYSLRPPAARKTTRRT